MSNIDKQALREEFKMMQDCYSDPADRDRQVIYLAAEALLDELEAAEKRITELEARTVTLPTPYPKGYGLAADKYNFALEECADAIRAAGIGVKGG